MGEKEVGGLDARAANGKGACQENVKRKPMRKGLQLRWV
jgi:hypothetical protein